MSSHNEQVKPAAFDVAAPVPEDSPAAVTRDHPERPGWIVPALLSLALVAVLVVFWLPGKVGPASVEAPAMTEPDQAVPATPARKNDQGPEASPWSDAQLAKLRKEAQDVLGELLEVQELLEGTGVELWAAEAYEQAKTHATTGDAQYRERQFEAATDSYREGLAAMKAILEREPDALAQQLELARQAIEQGERASAENALTIARAIEPGNAELAALSTRAETLEQVLPLLATAAAAEEDGDLARAEESLREAAELDPAHQRVQAELERVATAHTDQKFNDAMSDGYLALDEGKFSAARTAFKRAAALAPGSTEAASALQEVQVAETADQLQRLQDRGIAAEGKEEWQSAVEAYEKALSVDANLLFAQEGLSRSRTRAKLHKQFTTAIEDPDRLSDIAVAEATETLLRQAATLSPRGPVLNKQMAELLQLLEQANTPRKISVQSDGETEVIMYKVARLGRFQNRELTLRPGEYTAVGTRNGYRDVRVTFKLTHDGPAPSVDIRCTEQI